MTPFIQKQIAAFTLVAFSLSTFGTPRSHAGELRERTRDFMVSYSAATRNAESMSALTLMDRLNVGRSASPAQNREIFAVLNQSVQATQGNWARARNQNQNEFEVSAANYTAKVRFSAEDHNVVTINGQTFVLNDAKSLQENVDIISRAIAQKDERGSGLKIVRFFENLLVPEAKAMSTTAIVIGIVAVVAVIVAIMAISKYNKKKKAAQQAAARRGSEEEADSDDDDEETAASSESDSAESEVIESDAHQDSATVASNSAVTTTTEGDVAAE